MKCDRCKVNLYDLAIQVWPNGSALFRMCLPCWEAFGKWMEAGPLLDER